MEEKDIKNVEAEDAKIKVKKDGTLIIDAKKVLEDNNITVEDSYHINIGQKVKVNESEIKPILEE